MQDSIIVYRNPLEKAMWEGMSGVGFSTLLLFAAVMFFSFVALYFGITKVTGKGKWRVDGGDWVLGFSLVVSFLVACGAVWKWA